MFYMGPTNSQACFTKCRTYLSSKSVGKWSGKWPAGARQAAQASENARRANFRFAFRKRPVQDFSTGLSLHKRGVLCGFDPMKFRDVLNSDHLLLVACHDCGGKTPLDPAPIALRVGVQADIAEVTPELHCPVCGSADITLGVHSPVASREGLPQLAK